jgi:hypothetical protein
MNLIESIKINNENYRFYDGVDIDIIMKHPKDGSQGHIYCFFESFITEVKNWERASKINCVLLNEIPKKFNFDEIENDYVSLYQNCGVSTYELFKIVKNKIVKGQIINKDWIPISGLDKGGWNIVKQRILN